MLFDERVKKLKRVNMLLGKIWNFDDTIPTPTPTPTTTETSTPTPTDTPTATNTVTPTPWTVMISCLSSTEQQQLFGTASSLNFAGNRIIIGSPVGLTPFLSGSAQIFEKDPITTNWFLLTTLQDANIETNFGYSVDMNAAGDVVIVGAPCLGSLTQPGAAYVYKFDPGSSTWIQLGQAIDGLNISDQGGFAVSINGAGDIIAVGINANSELAALGGQVRVYRYESSSAEWVLQGQPIFGENPGSGLGGSVSLNFNGDILATGLPASNSFAANAGQVRIFSFDGLTWNQKGSNIDFDSGVNAGDFCGWAVCLNGPGDRIAIGYPFADTPFGINSNAGQARVYEFNNTSGSWLLLGSSIDSTQAGANTGYSVALNYLGDVLSVGAPSMIEGGVRVGAARTFQHIGGVWFPTTANFFGSIIYGNQRFGHSVSLNGSGNIVACGAPESNLPGKPKAGTLCFSETISMLPFPTPTPSSTPTPTQTPLPPCQNQQFFVNFQNSGYDVYRTCYYPITAIFTRNSRPINFSSIEGKTITACMSALDFWSKALDGSDFLAAETSDTIWDGNRWISNPLRNHENKGLLLTIDLFNDPTSGILGYAGIAYNRRWVATYNTNSFNTPYESFFALNTHYLTNQSLELNSKNRSQTFYVILHEIGHTLGIGPSWHNSYLDLGTGNRKLYNSFIVGAEDNTPNPLGLGLSANFFYALNNHGLRLETDVGKPTTIGSYGAYIGDADYKFAFNGYNVKTVSKAVSAYNEIFGLSLTAIPVENGRGFGSIGAHWDEGHSNSASYGSDDRAYYGSKYPGAPGLHDELMTPESEAPKINSPVSKITLGALEDLGYTVDYSMADRFEPLKHTIRYNGDINTPLCIDFNNFYEGAYCDLGNTPTSPGKEIKLRKGLTYTFKISSDFGDPIKLTSDADGTTLIPIGVTNNNTGTGSITYTVPTTLVTPMTAWIFASNPNAKASLLIL